MENQNLQISYDLVVYYAGGKGTELHNTIHNVPMDDGVLNIDIIKDLYYTKVYLVTIVKDTDGNIIKKSQCKIIEVKRDLLFDL